MRTLADELEVPGTVIMYKTMSRQEAINRMKKILSTLEDKGYTKFNDVPEGKLKEEFVISVNGAI